MTFTLPGSPSGCPEVQEALSRLHARDTLRVRLLESGRIAVWDQTLTLLGIADTFEEVIVATDHLRLLADRQRLEAEAARIALVLRAEEAAAFEALEIEL